MQCQADDRCIVQCAHLSYLNGQTAQCSDGTRQDRLCRQSTPAIWPGNVRQKWHCTSESSHYRRKRAKLLPPPALRRASQEQRHRHGANESSDRPSKRPEEHTSELQSLMRTSYAVLCLK